jgi:signal recognition particle receptor subunit beta
MHLQGASSAIVVADITRQVTVEHIPDHVQCFLSVNPKGSLIVALNKADLLDENTLEKMINLAAFKLPQQVIATYSTSAKTGSQVDQIFQQLAYQMLKVE